MTVSPAYEQWVDAARSVTCEDVIVARGIDLKRSGGELVGPCPVCGGEDRFSVNPHKNVFLCRVSGAKGDAIDLVEYLDSCDFKTAVQTLTGSPPPSGEAGAGVDPALAEKRKRARLEAEKKRKADNDHYRRQAQSSAHDKWRAATDPENTAVHDYWKLRGLTLPPPGRVIRYQKELPYWWHPKGKKEPPVEIHRGPAMLAAIQGPDGAFIGLHITWIDLNEPNGKAVIFGPDGKKQSPKKVNGSHRGGAIRLRDGPADFFLCGEGIETTESAYEAAATGDFGPVAAWVGINLGNMAGKADGKEAHPSEKLVDKLGRTRAMLIDNAIPKPDDRCLLLPEWATRAVYLMDGDSDFYVTRNAMTRAAVRNRRQGRHIGIADPGPGVDFNDLLRGKEGKAA